MSIWAATLCQGLSTPHIPLRRASPLPVRQRVSRSANLSLCLFCQLHFGKLVLVQVFREAGARAGVDVQEACGGKAVRTRRGEEKAGGGLQTSLRPPREGGDRTRPGCGQSQAVAGLQRGSPGRWRVLDQSPCWRSLPSCRTPECPVTVQEQPRESVASDECGGGSQGLRLGHRAVCVPQQGVPGAPLHGHHPGAGKAGVPEESPTLNPLPHPLSPK